MASSPSTRTKVFISYSHKDGKYFNELIEHLIPYEREQLLEIWSDQKIVAGAQWREEIKQAIETTKAAVLLLSPSFMASNFVAENELPPLLRAAEKEGVVILPVIVRPLNFEDTELADFQSVNNPSRSVAKMKPYQRDELWVKVVKEIQRTVYPLQKAQVKLPQNISVLEGINANALDELREEMQRQREADGLFMARVIDFRQAINARAWQQAEKMLQQYPHLPEARSSLGLGMSQEVQEYFSYQLYPNNPSLGGPVTSLHVLYDFIPPSPPLSEAIHWLEEAIQYQDDPEGQVTAVLASMYGYSNSYGHMIDMTQRALTINSSLASYFQSPHNFLMLLYACGTPASIEEVARAVGMKLPTEEDIRYALGAASDPQKNPYVFAKPYLEWYAIELGTRETSRMPIEVRIHFPKKDGLTYAQISRRGQVSVILPIQTTTTGIIDTLISVDGVLEQFSHMKIVLVLLK